MSPGGEDQHVDRLLAEGKIAEAAQRLEALLAVSPDLADSWLKLAGLRRALRQPVRALAAVHEALRVAPLDFVALVMRATLLERMDSPERDVAWARALAQKPVDPLPPPLATVVAQGEARHKRWSEARETRLTEACAAAEAMSGSEEAARIYRFRSNVLRRTRTWHSEPTHFAFPGLAEREFHPRSRFPWLAELETAADDIRGECEALLASERAELMPYIQYERHEALSQWRSLNHNPDWTAIHLWRNGERVAANADRCPRTVALLAKLPQPVIRGASPNAMFSLLAPGTTIPPHVGVSNARLVCHLPLIVPDGCWFRVGAERRSWTAGEAFVFDDTIEHEASNPSDRLRIVLIFDVVHPDLTPAECEAVRAVIEAEGRDGSGGL